MIRENTLNIYTDGSSYSKPRTGGIGIRYIYVDSNYEEKRIDLELPGYPGATNNQMELTACIQALKHSVTLDLDIKYNRIIVNTDSRYVVDNCYNAMYKWPKNHWCKSGGSPILNARLWKELVKCIKKASCRVEFEWLKGHSKDQDNKAADRLAKKSAKKPTNRPINVVTVRRKKSVKSIDLGSVRMQGQRLSIRIITSEYLNIQRINRYKYEVLSKRSKYYQNVDVACSNCGMSAGHTYIVTLNKNQNNPQILTVIKELIE